MNPLPILRRFSGGSAAALVFVAFACSAALAQSTGSLSGRVSDVATGKSLQGVVVRVLDTPLADYTDAEGRFSLPAVPTGPQRIEFDYVGLDRMVREVTIVAGNAGSLHASLESKALQMEAFTVADSARGQALAINQQKTASGIVNIVSEETFGQMIAGNIGYALQRLPGLSVNSDEDGTPSSVNIRGMPSEFNSFQIDGNRVPTSGGGRGFSTGQLVADGISNIEVVKAPTPDRDGDAIGGIINVTSRSAFQRDGRELKLTGSGVYYDLADDWGYNAAATYTDLLSIGRGAKKNLGISFTASTYETPRAYHNTDTDYRYLRPENNPGLALAEPIYFTTNSTVQTNIRKTESTGFNAAIDFRTDERNTFYFRPLFSQARTIGEKVRDRSYIDTRHQDALNGRKTIAAATATTGRSGPNSVGEMRYYGEETDTTNELYSLAAGGRHNLDTMVFNYDFFLSRNESQQDRSQEFVVRNPGFLFEYNQDNRVQPLVTVINGRDPLDTSTASRGDLVIDPRHKTEEVFSAKMDWEKKFAGAGLTGAFKTGLKYRSSRPEQDETSLIYRTGAGTAFPYAQVLRPSNRVVNGHPMTLEPDQAALDSLRASRPELFAFQADESALESLLADYSAEENTTAAYIMGTATWGRTTLIGGLRLEHNDWSSETFEIDPENPRTAKRISRGKDYDVYLPGLHLRQELRRNLILRASYNRSYGRPSLGSLTRGREVNFEDETIVDGNANLDPTTSNNFDAQLEYYTAKGGLYSIGLFYKDVKGFYYDKVGTEIVDVNGAPTVFTTEKPDNALGAVNYGVELIARQRLHFLPWGLNGFTLSSSATFSESDGKYPGRLQDDLPTYGFSDYMLNVALEYNIGRFRAQLAYRYRSEYLEGIESVLDLDDWFAAREQVDFESSYQLNRGLRFFFNVEDATKRPKISWQGNPRNPEDYNQYSYRATFGANYTF